MDERLDGRTLGAIAITLLFWSSAFAGIRAALPYYEPANLALLRFLVASAVLTVYAVATRMPLPAPRDLPGLALLGFVGITVYHVALTYGEVTVTAGAASLLIAAAPMFSALLAVLFLGERLKAWGWVGILVSFAGVALIAVGEGGGVRFDPGAALILLSAVCTSLYFVFQKPYFERYSSLQVTTYTIWAGTLFMLVFAPGLPADVASAPLNATLSVVYLGVFPAALSYVTWVYALSRAQASLVMSFLYVNPVLAIFVAWLWLAEIPTALSLAGGALALGGVIIVNTLGKQRAPAPGTLPAPEEAALLD